MTVKDGCCKIPFFYLIDAPISRTRTRCYFGKLTSKSKTNSSHKLSNINHIEIKYYNTKQTVYFKSQLSAGS